MKFAKRLWMVAGAVALAGLFSVMFAPKAVHAVVSTLVTVTNNVPVVNPSNTDGSSVPLQTQNSAPLPSQSLSSGIALSCVFSGGSDCVINPVYTIPPNAVAVVESISGQCNINSGSIDTIELATSIMGEPETLFVVPNSGVPTLGIVRVSFGQNLKGYFFGGASGQNLVIDVHTNTSEGTNNDCFVNLQGYLVQQ
jgi:hypothetical protein